MKEPKSKIEQLKAKLEKGGKLNDIGISVPSMDVKDYIRVLRLARKPSRDEFMMIGKVSMAGIALIGIIGFLIYVLLTELPRAL